MSGEMSVVSSNGDKMQMVSCWMISLVEWSCDQRSTGLIRWENGTGGIDSSIKRVINCLEIVMDVILKEDWFYEDGKFDKFDFWKPNYYKTPLK